MSHSKRNTSRAVFTSHERALARAAWGASSARLSRESFLPFAACGLCLEPARDPVACAAAGDVFCRECALANILAQRREIKRAARTREQAGREDAEEQGRREAEERERSVREFELVQAGLEGKVERFGVRRGGSGKPARLDSRPTEEDEERGDRRRSQGTLAALEDAPSLLRVESNGSTSEKRGEKRKFELDEDEVVRIAAEERAKARKAIEKEKAAKPVLPSFWTPSVTPSSNSKDTLHEVKKAVKTQPICPASQQDQPHSYSLHTLVTVQFTEETDPKTKTTQRICPACNKVLSNASKAMLAKPCGHVLCKSCATKFMTPLNQADPHSPGREAGSVRCYVCDADLTDRKLLERKESNGEREKEKEKIKPGLVELRSEGTGFSAGGTNEVQKNGVSFQC